DALQAAKHSRCIHTDPLARCRQRAAAHERQQHLEVARRQMVLRSCNHSLPRRPFPVRDRNPRVARQFRSTPDSGHHRMKLYYSPGACSLAVHIALREVRATFETVAVDLAKHTTADGRNYFDISPRGYVPLLQLDDGSRHTEAAALLQYVADLAPD